MAKCTRLPQPGSRDSTEFLPFFFKQPVLTLFFFRLEIMHVSIKTKENIVKGNNKFPRIILSLHLEIFRAIRFCTELKLRIWKTVE